MVTSDFAVVGNSLAAMVAATSLADYGRRVALINGARGWGGHFSTIECDGTRFDAGMVLHEFTAFNAAPASADVQTYDPRIRNDVGRFVGVIQAYVGRFQQSRPIATPAMYVNGRILDDLLIANQLQSLRSLLSAERIRSELVDLTRRPSTAKHASFKQAPGLFDTLDYASASAANHGATLHAELIEPFCRKALNASAHAILARYHRVGWLPLFYPETLLSYLDGPPQHLPATVFSYPAGECVGDITTRLLERINSDPAISVVRDPPTGMRCMPDRPVEIQFANREPLHFSKLAWGNSLTDLLVLLGRGDSLPHHERTSVALAFLRLPKSGLARDFSVLSVAAPESTIYRVTNQTRCAGIPGSNAHLVAELNIGFAEQQGVAATPADWKIRIGRDLVDLGVAFRVEDVQVLSIRAMNNALLMPSAANLSAYQAEDEEASVLAPTIERLAASSGFFTSSYNDQIVQGLRLARRWSGSI